MVMQHKTLSYLTAKNRDQIHSMGPVAEELADCIRSSGLVWRFSRTSVFRRSTSLASQTSVWLNIETWLCHRPELSSVGGASTLQHVWNVLPVYLHSTFISWEQFRAGLKTTNLFNQAYDILWEHFCFKSVLYLLAYLQTTEWHYIL